MKIREREREIWEYAQPLRLMLARRNSHRFILLYFQRRFIFHAVLQFDNRSLGSDLKQSILIVFHA